MKLEYLKSLFYNRVDHNILNKDHFQFCTTIAGKIRKRGFKVKTWKDRWLVLTPTRLRYFVGSDEKILKGTIEFDSECTLEVSQSGIQSCCVAVPRESSYF